MQFGKKQQLTLIVLFAAVIVTVFYLTNNTKNPAQEAVSQTGSEPSDTLPETDIASNPEPDATSGVNPDNRTSYRIKAGKDQGGKSKVSKESKTIESRTDTDWENPLDAQSTVESAVAGNADDAIEVSDLIRNCMRSFDSELQIRLGLEQAAKRAAQGNSIPSIYLSGSGETLKFAKFNNYEEFMWAQFAQCESTRGMFDQGLRDRLARMATNGSVSARFLYAMWPPSQEKTTADRLVAWLEYQSNALEFTWQNIHQQEPLGLLAFGQSLEAPTATYFTAKNPFYGQAFILAAEKCGLNNQMVNKKVNNLGESWKQPQMIQYITQMESLTDEIMEMFCN